MRRCRFPLRRQEAIRLDSKRFYTFKWNPQTRGAFPRDQGQHLVKCSKNIYMPLRVMSICRALTCCQWLEAQERPWVHHFTDRNVGGGGWGHRQPGTEKCSHCLPVHMPWAWGPRAPRVQGSWCLDYTLNLQAPQFPRRGDADMEGGAPQK